MRAWGCETANTSQIIEARIGKSRLRRVEARCTVQFTTVPVSLRKAAQSVTRWATLGLRLPNNRGLHSLGGIAGNHFLRTAFLYSKMKTADTWSSQTFRTTLHNQPTDRFHQDGAVSGFDRRRNLQCSLHGLCVFLVCIFLHCQHCRNCPLRQTRAHTAQVFNEKGECVASHQAELPTITPMPG